MGMNEYRLQGTRKSDGAPIESTMMAENEEHLKNILGDCGVDLESAERLAQSDSQDPLIKRIVEGFLLAASATYIPIAAFGVYITLELKINPPPDAWAVGIGAALCFYIFGPLCSLVVGVVGALLVGYRRIHRTQ